MASGSLARTGARDGTSADVPQVFYRAFEPGTRVRRLSLPEAISVVLRDSEVDHLLAKRLFSELRAECVIQKRFNATPVWRNELLRSRRWFNCSDRKELAGLLSKD